MKTSRILDALTCSLQNIISRSLVTCIFEVFCWFYLLSELLKVQYYKTKGNVCCLILPSIAFTCLLPSLPLPPPSFFNFFLIVSLFLPLNPSPPPLFFSPLLLFPYTENFQCNSNEGLHCLHLMSFSAPLNTPFLVFLLKFTDNIN